MQLTESQKHILDRMQSETNITGPTLCWAKIANSGEPETLQWFASGGMGDNFFHVLKDPQLAAASKLLQAGFLEATETPSPYYNMKYRKITKTDLCP